MTGKLPYEKLEKRVGQLEKKIVELKRSKNAVFESEKRYREFVKNTGSIILRIDPRGDITFLNQFALGFFGFRRSEIIGKPAVGTIVPKTDSAGRDLSELIQQIIQHPEKYVTHENENQLKTGERVWISWSNTPIRIGNTIEIISIGHDITYRKRMEETLRIRELQLHENAQHLAEVNRALKAMLDHREVEKRSIEEAMLVNLKKLVFPYLEKMETCNLDSKGKTYLDIIRSNLEDLISPLSKKLFSKYLEFTPAEIHVADYIRQGKTSKQISNEMNVSTSSVSFHRYNIRRKLGLLNKNINLTTYFNSLAN
jgi:PAS domain S-box-containing protein